MTPQTIEAVRDYWDSRPCNIRHSPAQVGTKLYFDQVEARKYFVEPHIPAFANFDAWKGKRVLEIGCGIGTDTINFARAGATVTAVDLSQESIAVARKRASVFGVADKIKFVVGDAERLRDLVPEEPYDLIYSFGVIHHSPSPETVMANLKYYTKPGTVLNVMVYHRHSWKVWWILFRYGWGTFWKIDDLVAWYSEAQTGCPVTYTYTKDQARKLVEDAGFTIDEMRVDHIFPYSIPEYIRYQYKKVWYFRWMPYRLFRWLEHRYGWHLLVTAKWVGV